MGYFTVMNINAARCGSNIRISKLTDIIDDYCPDIVSIQEINIAAALRGFSSRFQVYCNIESDAKDGVGIVCLVNHGIKVDEVIVGINGRILGLFSKNYQIWNVYPKSGTAHKKERETFFREDLNELFVQWKDQSKYLFQMGDHNCTHRNEDS